MNRCFATVALIVTATAATGCSTNSGNQRTTNVMTPQQAIAESNRREAALRAEANEPGINRTPKLMTPRQAIADYAMKEAEIRAEANAPGMNRTDYLRMMRVVKEQTRLADAENAKYEEFKSQQQLALAEASAPRITVVNGGSDMGALPANYTRGPHHGKAGYTWVSYPSGSTQAAYGARDRVFLSQQPASSTAGAPARFYKRQMLENSADQLVKSAAEAARDAAASDAAANMGAPFADPAPGRPGYGTSPASNPDGLIDMRGYAPGTSVVDPYTGKVIRVP